MRNFKYIIIVLCLCILRNAQAQDVCNDNIYLSQGNNTRLIVVGTDTNPFTFTEVGTASTNNPENIRYNARLTIL